MNNNNVWKTDSADRFAAVMSLISEKSDMKSFLRDVMTEKEIVEVSSRLEAARLLAAGEKYTEITKKTKLSSRTVARISKWVKNGCNGYSVALDIVQHHDAHIRPARAK